MTRALVTALALIAATAALADATPNPGANPLPGQEQSAIRVPLVTPPVRRPAPALSWTDHNDSDPGVTLLRTLRPRR